MKMKTDPKADSVLDEANRLFLHGRLRDAISYYDRILSEDPGHLGSLNNKGYALSKLKEFEAALRCYDAALQISPDDIAVLVNKVSLLRKTGKPDDALYYCDQILAKYPDYNTALYHKERILFQLERYEESVRCCDKILSDYPENGDVLFDKSCSLAMQSDPLALAFLGRAISCEAGIKDKAKKSKVFRRFATDPQFQRLLS